MNKRSSVNDPEIAANLTADGRPVRPTERMITAAMFSTALPWVEDGSGSSIFSRESGGYEGDVAAARRIAVPAFGPADAEVTRSACRVAPLLLLVTIFTRLHTVNTVGGHSFEAT